MTNTPDTPPAAADPVNLSAELAEVDAALNDLLAARKRLTEAADTIAKKRPNVPFNDWTVDPEKPDHIWVNAFACIRPTDEFAAEVGRSVIRKAMESHPRRITLTINAS